MNKHMQPNGEDSHPIRKVLKSLHRVQTSAGFEQRLLRRIGDQQEGHARSERGFSMLRPIPSFAYSIFAVVIVGVLAYSVFVRTGISPTSPNPNVPVLRETGPNQSVPSSEIVPPALSKQPSPSASQPEKELKPERATLEKQILTHEGRTGEKRDFRTTEEAGDQSVQVQDPRMTSEVQLNNPEESAATKTEHNAALPVPAVAQRHMVFDKTKSTTGTLELKSGTDTGTVPTDGRRIVDPRIKDALGVGIMNTPVTSLISDSAKTDSLKKLQKQILQTKTKGKKPFD